jgi:hypothetical protein
MPLLSGLKKIKVLIAFSAVNSTNKMEDKYINKSQHALPHYETIASAGMDLRAILQIV